MSEENITVDLSHPYGELRFTITDNTKLPDTLLAPPSFSALTKVVGEKHVQAALLSILQELVSIGALTLPKDATCESWCAPLLAVRLCSLPACSELFFLLCTLGAGCPSCSSIDQLTTN